MPESVYSYTVIRARGRGSLPAAPNFELPLLLSSAPDDGSTHVFKFTHTARAAAGAPPRARRGARARERDRARVHIESSHNTQGADEERESAVYFI